MQGKITLLICSSVNVLFSTFSVFEVKHNRLISNGYLGLSRTFINVEKYQLTY